MATGKYAEWLTESSLTLLEGWARDGLTDEQIAQKMGISPRTYYEWLKKYPQISQAIKKGKAPVDYEVENTLLKKALGFTVTVKKAFKLRSKKHNGKVTVEDERIEYADEEIYIPPDTTAQIFWLKNRRPDKWRDKPEANQNGGNEILQSLYDLMQRRENEQD